MTRETFFARSARTLGLIAGIVGTTLALAQAGDPATPQPATPTQPTTPAQPTNPPAEPATPAQPATTQESPPPGQTAAVEPSSADPGSTQPPVTGKNSIRVVDRIVAVVNDEVITSNELQSRLRVAESQLKRQNITLPARPVLMKTVLERMIIDRAQLQMAKETGVRVDDATVNAAIQRIADQNGLSLPQFRERIDKEGLSFGRFRDDVRDDIVMGRLRDREVDSKIQIGEGEIDNFLAEKAGVEVNSVEYNIAQIMLRVPEAASSEAIEA